MHYLEVGVSGHIRGDKDTLTYHSATAVPVGSLVRVPLGTSTGNGVVFKHVSKPKFKTRAVESVLDDTPLPHELLKLIEWMSDYYVAHLPLVLQHALPRGLQRSRRPTKERQLSSKRHSDAHLPLTTEQKQALQRMKMESDGSFVLKGVTGSGKTRVYKELARDAQKHGRSALILVPEISLTSQLVAEFEQEFTSVIVFHSALSESTRHQMWLKILHTTEPLVVIGPRSALFTPIAQLGLIVIDEFHEEAYKQDQTPKYYTPRVASYLGRLYKARVVFGSATPPVAELHIAQQKNVSVVELANPVRINKNDVVYTIIDNRERESFAKNRWLSDPLLTSIEKSLSNKQQSLLFLNRRGSAPIALCKACGWVAECPTCFVPLTLHADRSVLKCHICGHETTVLPNCPQCHSVDIQFKGIGTKQVVSELKKHFPGAKIARYDSDTPKKQSLAATYQAVYDGDIDILVGTQGIAKGLDLPKLTTVGVVLADTSLFLPDFSSSERTFQLLYQVAGRVGRHGLQGSVFVQTFNPEHPSIVHAIKRDYDGFYERELADRKRAHYPPFRFLLKIQIERASRESAHKAAHELMEKIQSHVSGVQLLGPTPAFHERFGNKYRWQVVVKARQRATLTRIVRDLVPPQWQVDIDPTNLL